MGPAFNLSYGSNSYPTMDCASIFDADLSHEIDNMEGIDAHVTPEGDTVLTMISDDNFSMIQRTLLLQFTLVE